jgi:ketosteroid isomerase-like protein
MIRRLLCVLFAAGLVQAAHAQNPDNAADHDALRKLKADIEQAIAKRDFDAMKGVLHQPFMATVVTQKSFTELGALKAYYDGLFSRNVPRLKNIAITAEADELSQIVTGTMALTRGATNERYELADGRTFDMNGRWTAMSIKEGDGSWRLMAIHTGIDFLDNPVLLAVEKSVLWFGAGGLVIGLVAGLVGGWLLSRRRAR